MANIDIYKPGLTFWSRIKIAFKVFQTDFQPVITWADGTVVDMKEKVIHINQPIHIDSSETIRISSKGYLLFEGKQIHLNTPLDENGEPIIYKPKHIPYKDRKPILRHQLRNKCKGCH